MIEGALKNVKEGSILNINHERAKEIFINRLKLMTEYVRNVGEEVIGGQRIKDKYFIESTGSDPHANGQHALFLINRINSKERLVYKPHSLEFEKAFMGKDGFLDSLNTCMNKEDNKFKIMDINPTTHTEEFISRVGDKDSPITEINFKKHMKQLGMLQIASHIFGITDLHCENIIFGNDGPVAIDAECGGEFYIGTGMEEELAPVKTAERELANSSALYVGGEQKIRKGGEYEEGKLNMSKIMKAKHTEILQKCGELLGTIDKFRILPFGTRQLAVSLDEYVATGNLENTKEYKKKFFNYFNTSPLFKNNVILELDEFYIFFLAAIKNGTLPAFEFDLKKQVILLDNNPVGHVKSGIDIKEDWYRRLGRRDISIFGKWKKDFIWEQTQLNFTDASRAMKIVMNIYQN